MKISFLIISSFLSWAAFDPNLFRRRGHTLASTEITFSIAEIEDELQQEKKVQKQRLEVIRARYRNLKKKYRSKLNYFSSKPRDVRFSNQRKIRRMFNNA